MLLNLNTTISSTYRDALAERLQKFILPEGVSIPLQQSKAAVAARYPDNLPQIRGKAIEAITHTEEITESIGKILAKAVEFNPVIDEKGDRSPDNFQNTYYLGRFLDPLNRFIDGKQTSEITKNQMMTQTTLPQEFSHFLDKILPEIAQAAQSRTNIITELTEDFVSKFKKVVREHLGDYALEKLEKLDSIIVKNLEQIKKRLEESGMHLDFNLDRYTAEFTQDRCGNPNGLNIYIGVDNQVLPSSQNPKSTLLREIAVNIFNGGFQQVREVSNEVGQGYQDVYRIAIPLEKPPLPSSTLN
jgi:hypothetical protein